MLAPGLLHLSNGVDIKFNIFSNVSFSSLPPSHCSADIALIGLAVMVSSVCAAPASLSLSVCVCGCCEELVFSGA